MYVRFGLVVAAAALVVVVAAGAAPQGKPGAWTRVTDTQGRNIDQVGVTRIGNGKLHVVWLRRAGGEESIMHTPIAANGAVGTATAVLGGFKSVGNPDVVVMPDGKLRVFFAGLGATVQEGGVVSASAPANGVGWVRDGTRVSSTWSSVGPVGAAVAGDGTPLFAYGMSFALGLHVGLDSNTPDANLAPDKRCCDYVPDLATDAHSKASYVAWFSNADGRAGVWAQRVAPALGPRQKAPGSAKGDNAVGQDGRTAITARLGAPGVYVAYCSGYPSCKSVLVWRQGGGVLNAGGSPDVEDVAIAAAPEGRIWVTWHDGQNTRRILARRSNKAVTRFGPTLVVVPPAKTEAIWKLDGEGSLGRLDLLASVSTSGSLATWHSQVLPPLTLAATVDQKKNTVTLTVTDVGDPVGGATISLGGKTLKTNGAGHASTTLAPGTYTAKASKAEYVAHTAKLTVQND